MAEAPVTPEVVKWAIDESGLTTPEVAKRLKLDSAVVSAWTEGTSKPSKGQLTHLAAILKRPRAMFFLPKVPVSSSLPDGLRTAAGVRIKKSLTFDERLFVREARRLQEFLTTFAGPAPELPTASENDDPQDVGQLVRAWIGVNWETQSEWTTASQAYKGWRDAIEASGVATLALQLGQEGIRGFSLYGDSIPMIAVNTADSPEARSYTLFHEIAHLTLGAGRSCAGKSRGGIERWCDRVASHTLIPRSQLAAEDYLRKLDDLKLITRVARRFQVSRRAAALALEDVGTGKSYYGLVEATWPSSDRRKAKGGGRSDGRTSPQIRVDEYGKFAVGSVIRALDEGKVNELQVRDYLGLDHAQLSEASHLLSERAG